LNDMKLDNYEDPKKEEQQDWLDAKRRKLN
jgi:hypothetical protein